MSRIYEYTINKNASWIHICRLVQERRNSIANALELEHSRMADFSLSRPSMTRFGDLDMWLHGDMG